MTSSAKSSAGRVGARLLLVALGCSQACTDRKAEESELGREFALHLCPIQAGCGCDPSLVISNCEERVEHEFGRTERAALEHGLVLDERCMDRFLDHIAGLGACEPYGPALPPCPVYTGDAGEGEPCVLHGLLPLMTDCRADLQCVEGTCRDLENPRVLMEGEICSDTQSSLPTGFLGECAESLVCDASETRTCVPAPYWPKVSLGGVCTSLLACEDGSYCRPPGSNLDVSEDSPGVCMRPTAPGEPCTLPYECDTSCEDGVCSERPLGLCQTLESWWLVPTVIR